MPALSNPRWEQFCQLYARDGNAVQSYLSAYPKSTYAAAGNSSYELLKIPEISSRVGEIQKSLRRRLERLDFQEQKNRVALTQEMLDRMRSIVSARAEDMADVPGGEAGLMVRQVKKVGEQIIEEYAVDTGLLKEIREYLKQTAVEVGQWTEKQEHAGTVGLFDASRLQAMTDEQLLKLIELKRQYEQIMGQAPAQLPAPEANPPEESGTP